MCTVSGCSSAYYEVTYYQCHIEIGTKSHWLLHLISADNHFPRGLLTASQGLKLSPKQFNCPNLWFPFLSLGVLPTVIWKQRSGSAQRPDRFFFRSVSLPSGPGTPGPVHPPANISAIRATMLPSLLRDWTWFSGVPALICKWQP